MTPAKIAQVKATLRLQPDQVQHWPPVANALNDIGRDQMSRLSAGKTRKSA